MKYVIFVFLIAMSQLVSANLLISPTRINFDNRDRIQEVILINTTTDDRTYRISWSEKKIGENGKYVELADNDNSVDRLSPFVRFSPRQVFLKSGERQVIKLQLRKKSNMNASEYRSHLLFSALPSEDDIIDNDDEVEGMRMMMNMLVSYSIPVLYHPSKPTVDITIGNHEIIPREDQGADLQLNLRRSGENSAYGRIEVHALVDGKDKRIGLANNVSVFREVDQKLQNVRIPEFKSYGSIDNVRIRYIGEKEYAGQTLAERRITL